MSRKLSASFVHISSGYKTKRVETGVKCAKIERKSERQGERKREERKNGKGCKSDSRACNGKSWDGFPLKKTRRARCLRSPEMVPRGYIG